MWTKPRIAGMVAAGSVAFLVALLCGCGRRGPDVQMVLGKATLDGQPLAGATVTLAPRDKNTGLSDPNRRLVQADGRSRWGSGTRHDGWRLRRDLHQGHPHASGRRGPARTCPHHRPATGISARA